MEVIYDFGSQGQGRWSDGVSGRGDMPKSRRAALVEAGGYALDAFEADGFIF